MITIEHLTQMSDGNIGAATVIAALMQLDAAPTIEKLKRLNIKGPPIWVIYKDCCDGSARTMIDLVERCPDDLLIEASKSDDRQTS